MPRVKLSKVLEKIETEMHFAMDDALRDVRAPGKIDAGELARAFRMRLESRTSNYIRVPDSAVTE